jgi:hypothetical protein
MASQPGGTGTSSTTRFEPGARQAAPVDLQRGGAQAAGTVVAAGLAGSVSGTAVALAGAGAFAGISAAQEAKAAVKPIELETEKGKPQYGPGGTYYRKVESTALPNNVGLTATVTLPTPQFDASRIDTHATHKPWNEDPNSAGPREHPAIYLGGTGRDAKGKATEVDAGLTWMPVLTANKTPTYTDRKAEGTSGGNPANVFVPVKDGKGEQQLWRQSDIGVKDAKPVASGPDEVAKYIKDNLVPNYGYRVFWRTNSGKDNVYDNPNPAKDANPYFYPGQKVELGVTVTGPGKAQLSVKLDGSSTGGFSKEVNAPGFGTGKAVTFKRVASIDQEKKGNDDKAEMEPTKSTLTGGAWNRVQLLQDAAGDKKSTGYAAAGEKVKAVPLTGANAHAVFGSDIGDQHKNIFKLSPVDASGGERFDIDASKYIPKPKK